MCGTGRNSRLGFTASLLLAVLAAAHALAGPAKPNIVLILTDDQGYGDLSCHGNPVLKTPTLDKLHAESIRLTDFHVMPMCTPTRGQLLTGRHALASGAYCVCSGRTFLRRDLPTMAELFAAGGYRTGLFGKWHLGDNYPHRPNDRGFQERFTISAGASPRRPTLGTGTILTITFVITAGSRPIAATAPTCSSTRLVSGCACAARREPFLLYLRRTRPRAVLLP